MSSSNNKFWTWRKGREMIQFDSEETMNSFNPPEDSWWSKKGPGLQMYSFLSPRQPNIDLIKNTMIDKNEGYGIGLGDPRAAFKGARWTVKYNEGMGGGDAAMTPRSAKDVKSLVVKIKPNMAISFYSLTNPNLHVAIRRSGDKNYEVFDSNGANYRLVMPQDKSKLDMLINQIALKSRRYNQHRTFSTISTRPHMSPPKDPSMKKSEIKEVIQELVKEMWADTNVGDGEPGEGGEDGGLKTTGRAHEPGSDAALVDLYKNGGTGQSSTLPSVGGAMSEVSPMKAAKILNKNVKQGIVKKSDVRNMGVKVSENDEYDKMLSNQLGQKCPKCKKFHASGGSSLKVLNPSNPTVYQCGHCGNKWNPDNDTSNITKVGDKSVLGQPVAEAKITHLQKLIRETVSEILKEVAPGGWEGNVDTTKKHPQINNPSSLSNYIKSNVR